MKRIIPLILSILMLTFALPALAEAPLAPANVTVTLADSEATLRWSPPGYDGGTPIVGYEVSLLDGQATEARGDWQTVANHTQYRFKDLKPGQTYTVFTRAVTAAGTGPAAFLTFTAETLDASAPAVPADIVVTPENDACTVTWASAEPQSGYAITGDLSTTTTEPTCTFTELPNGNSLTLYIRATGGYAAVTKAFSAAPPSAPRDATATQRADGGYDLAWKAPADGTLGVACYLLMDGDATLKVLPSDATGDTFTGATLPTLHAYDGYTVGPGATFAE